MSETPAYLSVDYVRLWDLVRFARGYLLDKNLISPQEYSALLGEETEGRPGQGSPAPRRLERYDDIRARLEAAEAEVRTLRAQLEAALSPVWPGGEGGD